MENHDQAYHLWHAAKLRDRVLVHIDAHHDMWWAGNPPSVSIGNYISLALQEGIVREVRWVVPDATWGSAAGRKAVDAHVRAIHERFRERRVPVHRDPRRVRTAILGRPLVICALDSLPETSECVLLDIDVDYLVISSVSFGGGDRHSVLPWLWPVDLVARLRANRVVADFVTIAYSVEGGYTPMQWKYLGGELARRLRMPEGEDSLEPFERMREGALAQAGGDPRRAEEAFRAVGDRLGGAPHFFLAYILADQGRMDDARRCYDRARALDPSLRSAYASPGISPYLAGAYDAAATAFARTLLLNPADASSHLGLGWLAARRKRWSEAEKHARAVLALEHDSIDAHRLLARSLEKQSRLDQAIQAYEHSQKLALAGHRPLNGVIATDSHDHPLLDPDHPRIHARLARLYAATGDVERAITGYRIAIAGGFDTPGMRFRLAGLYRVRHRWREALRHLSAGVRKIPAELAAWASRPRDRGANPVDPQGMRLGAR